MRKPGAACATQPATSTSMTNQRAPLCSSNPLGAPASQVRPFKTPFFQQHDGTHPLRPHLSPRGSTSHRITHVGKACYNCRVQPSTHHPCPLNHIPHIPFFPPPPKNRNQRQAWWPPLHPTLDISSGHQGNPRASVRLALCLHAVMPSPIPCPTTGARRTPWLPATALKALQSAAL